MDNNISGCKFYKGGIDDEVLKAKNDEQFHISIVDTESNLVEIYSESMLMEDR